MAKQIAQNSKYYFAQFISNLRKHFDRRWADRYTAGYDPDTDKHIIKKCPGRTREETKETLKAAVEQAQQVDVSHTDEYIVAG